MSQFHVAIDGQPTADSARNDFCHNSPRPTTEGGWLEKGERFVEEWTEKIRVEVFQWRVNSDVNMGK